MPDRIRRAGAEAPDPPFTPEKLWRALRRQAAN